MTSTDSGSSPSLTVDVEGLPRHDTASVSPRREPDGGAAPWIRPGAQGPGGGRLRRQVTRSRIALLAVLLLTGGLIGLHIHAYRLLSVYDEPQHIDYVYHLLQGEIPASGDHWLDPTVAAVACRGIDYPLDKYPPCGGPATPDLLPNGGLTTAFGHTPAYYLLPAGAVWATAHLLPGHIDEVSAMRSTGVFWFALAIVLLWLICRDLGVAWPTRAALSIGLAVSPVVLLSEGAVTNDAAALAAGAAVTLATLRWEAGRVRLWVPAVVSLLAVLLKVTNMAALLLACAFVLIRCLQRSELPHRLWWKALNRRLLLFAGLLGGATALVGLGWSVYSGSRATLDPHLIPQNIPQIVNHFDPSWLATSVLSMTSPLQLQFLQASLQGSIGTIAGAMTNVGLLVLAVVGAVRSRPGSVVRALAIAAGIAMLGFGPLMTLTNYITVSAYFVLPARYGLALVPAMAAVGGTAVRSRAGQLLLLGAAVLLYAAMAFRLLP